MNTVRAGWKGGLAVVAGAAVGALALAAMAGPLNPPAGPVSPTGKTLDEVFAAIAGASGGNPNSIGVPGTARSGTMTMTATFGAGSPQVLPVYAWSVKNMMVTPSGGGGAGTPVPTQGTLLLTFDLTKNSARMAQAFRLGGISNTLTFNATAGADPITYTLTNVVITSMRYYSLPRADGQVAHLVDVEFGYQTSNTNVGGQMWQFP